MSMRTTVNQQTRDALRRVRAELSGAAGGRLGKELVQRVGDVDVMQASKVYATQGAESGEPWKRLEDENKGYAAWKRRNYPGKKLLIWTGEKSRDPVRHMSHPEHIARMSGDVLEFGTKSKLAIKLHEGEKYGTWQVRYLKENRPVFPKGSKWRQRREGDTGRFASGRERAKKGRVVRGRNWFRFVFKSIPARPIVRKSPAQMQELQRAMAKVLLSGLARAAGPSTVMGQAFAEAAGAINVRA